MTSNKDFVTARDLLANTFVITVHRSILERFYKAIRQRQVVLSQYGIPPEVVSIIVPATPTSPQDNDSPTSILNQDYLEALAFCFYHFINFKYYEPSKSTKMWEVKKDDFEDKHEKAVTCYVSKLTVSFNCLILRATLGFRDLHTVLWCAPSGVIAGLVPELGAAKPVRRLLSTSDKKYLSVDEHHGTWSIMVDLRRPNTAQATNAFSARQLSDVVEFVVSIKPRHDLNPYKTSIMGKLPTPVTVAAPEDDEVEEEEEDSPGDTIFTAPLRFSTPRTISGLADPTPLPRNPLQYTLPPNVNEGPSIPPYTPWTPIPPRVLDPQPEAYALTPLKLSTSQSYTYKVKDPETGLDVSQFTQFVDFSVRILNKTEKPLVFQPPANGQCVDENGSCVMAASSAEWGTDGEEGEVLSVGPLACVTTSIRCKYPLRGVEPGADHFERALLDPSVFPQPAHFQVTLVEAHSGQESVFEMHQYNPDRDLPNKEKYIADTLASVPPEDVFLYVSADDTVRLRRSAASVYLDRAENHMVVARRNSKVYLPLQKIQAIAYECLMSGKTEYEIASFSDSSSFAAWVLMSDDVHPSMAYGIKVQIKTPTSLSIGYCHIAFPGTDWIIPTAGSSAASSRQNSEISMGSPHPTIEEARAAILNSGSNQPFEAPLTLPREATQPKTSASGVVTPSETHSDPNTATSTKMTGAAMGYSIMYDTPIGSGAFGTVYKAFDRLNGRTVAVKESCVGGPIRGSAAGTTTVSTTSASSTVNSTASSSSDRKEFDVLVKLSHPNIVKVFEMDIGRDTGILRVFMEWVPGGSVSSVVSRGRFRLHENVVKQYARDALQGLAYLHQRNILHLDVKPHNMLVSHEGHVKLADFGTTLLLSKAMTSISSHAVVGTPAYMAPEIITAGKYYRGSDIWAWAASVVEMASGHQPWHHLPEEKRNSSLPLMFHIASAKSPDHAPIIPAHLSQDLKDVLTACFSPSLSLRPSADSLITTDYFKRDTLPLDAEALETFYELSKAASTDGGVQDELQTNSTCGSWTTVGSTYNN